MEAQADCEDWLALTQLQGPTSVTAACVGTFSEVQPGVLLLAVARQNQLDLWQRVGEDDEGELRLLLSMELPERVDHLAALPGPSPGAPDALLLTSLRDGRLLYAFRRLTAAANGSVSLRDCASPSRSSLSEGAVHSWRDCYGGKDGAPRLEGPLFSALAPAAVPGPGAAGRTAGLVLAAASSAVVDVEFFCWERGSMTSRWLYGFSLDACEPFSSCVTGVKRHPAQRESTC